MIFELQCSTLTQHDAMLIRCYLLLLFILSPALSQSQSSSRIQNFIQAGQYWQAIDEISKKKDIKDDEKALETRAICFYELSQYQSAIKDIARSKSLGNRENALNYYLARSYHAQGRYKKAINWYKEYLAGKRDKKINESDIIVAIEQCFYALNTNSDTSVLVEQLPEPVNSRSSEEALLRSPNHPSTIYFGRFSSFGNTVKSYAFETGTWNSKKQILTQIKSENFPIIRDISPDGQIIFFEANLNKADVVLYNKSGEEKNVYKASFPYFPDLGDKDLRIVNKNTILFSSLRPEGYGGYDIYVSRFSGGKWSFPQNLGPKINSTFDEVSPFITEDEGLLFFSSNRRTSIGGHDIFYSKKENNAWSKARNAGVSLNSPADDLNFRLEEDGITASFSSNRAGSFGGSDLFFAYFQNKWETSLSSREALSYISYSIEPSEEASTEAGTEKEKRTEEGNPPETDISEPAKKELTEVTGIASTPESQSSTTNPAQPETKTKKEKEKRSERRKKKEVVLTEEQRVISPLFYSDEKQILTAENKRQLENLLLILKTYPKMQVELTNSIHPGPLKEFELYFGIIWIDEVVDYLTSRGVDKDRIIVNSLGASFPYVNYNMGGAKEEDLSAKNQRIDILLYGDDQEAFYYTGFEDVKDVHRDRRYSLYRITKDDVHFRVKFAESERMFKNAILRLNDDIMITRDLETNALVYSLGFYESFSEAQRISEELKTKGLTNVQVIPFKGSLELNKDEINSRKDQNYELKRYLDSL